MNKIEKKRAALERLVHYGSVELEDANLIMAAADAYALQAHVDECHAYPDEHGKQQWHPEARRCGDDWYCDKAKVDFPMATRLQ